MNREQTNAIIEVINFINSKTFQCPKGSSSSFIYTCGQYNKMLQDANVDKAIIKHIEKLFTNQVLDNWNPNLWATM